MYILKGDLGAVKARWAGMCCCVWDPSLSGHAVTRPTLFWAIYTALWEKDGPSSVSWILQGLFLKVILMTRRLKDMKRGTVCHRVQVCL